MPARGSLPALLAAGILLSACASPQQIVQQHEDRLAAAGFTALPANTPSRAAELQALPPNRFVRRTHGDHFVYLYADPLVCNCLYIGGQAAYGRYQQQMLAQNIANQQLLAAQMNEDAAWNWGPWGPGWW